jgi:hypothetical protein
MPESCRISQSDSAQMRADFRKSRNAQSVLQQVLIVL